MKIVHKTATPGGVVKILIEKLREAREELAALLENSYDQSIVRDLDETAHAVSLWLAAQLDAQQRPRKSGGVGRISAEVGA